MIKITHKGDFKRTQRLLNKIINGHFTHILERYGQMGVDALASATPVRTGLTASSWNYEIEINHGDYSIVWTNSHVEDGYANIALLLQYGHGTRTGGYVKGRDYINPAIQPIFDEMADKIWEEVVSE